MNDDKFRCKHGNIVLESDDCLECANETKKLLGAVYCAGCATCGSTDYEWIEPNRKIPECSKCTPDQGLFSPLESDMGYPVKHSSEKSWMDKLESGRELDDLVAEKVMGYRIPVQESLIGNEWSPIPHYSTDIAAAWQVIEKLTSQNAGPDKACIEAIINTPKYPGWPTYVRDGEEEHQDEWCVEWVDGIDTIDVAFGKTAPLAICRAALKIMEVRNRL